MFASVLEADAASTTNADDAGSRRNCDLPGTVLAPPRMLNCSILPEISFNIPRLTLAIVSVVDSPQRQGVLLRLRQATPGRSRKVSAQRLAEVLRRHRAASGRGAANAMSRHKMPGVRPILDSVEKKWKLGCEYWERPRQHFRPGSFRFTTPAEADQPLRRPLVIPNHFPALALEHSSVASGCPENG